ncbi:MAG: hypothetical protein GXP46_05140 [Deferribacteres bacterium]|nr:hypothetical protein [Deferribacteres bacterium]
MSTVDMEKFFKVYKRNLIFRQCQGLLPGDEMVGEGVCSALSYEWVKQNLTGNYNVQNWTRENPLFRTFAVPENSPIGRRFPHLTEVRIGMRRVPPGMQLKQKIANLSRNTLGVERNFELLARKDHRRVSIVHKWSGLNGGWQVAEQIQKHSIRFFGGYGLIGLLTPGGHATACQIAGSINRYYDPNIGEFSFANTEEFMEAFALMWEMADYKYRDLYLWTMY